MKTLDDPAVEAFRAGGDFYDMVGATQRPCGLPWREVREKWPAACESCSAWWRDTQKCGTWVAGGGMCAKPMDVIEFEQRVADLEKKTKARGKGK